MKLHKLEFSSASPAHLETGDPGVVVWSDDANGPAVIAKLVDEWCWFKVPGLGSFRLAPSSPDLSVRGLAYPDPGAEQHQLRDAYYRSVVPLALTVYGLEAMHGAAVETAAGAVVLGGRSHVGKSTLAHALAARGSRVIADDGVVFEVPAVSGGDARPLLRPIPFALMLRDAAAAHFGRPELSYVVDDEEGSAASASLPLMAVVLLDRVPDSLASPIRATRLTPQESFTELLRSSYAFSFDKKARTAVMVRAYTSFARTVPVFRLTFTSGFEYLDAAALAIQRLAAHGFDQGPSDTSRDAAWVLGTLS